MRCHCSRARTQKTPRRAAIPASPGREKLLTAQKLFRCATISAAPGRSKSTFDTPPFWPRPGAKNARCATIPAPGCKKEHSTRCHSGRARTQKNALGAPPFRPRLAAFPGVLATVRSSPRVSPSAPKKHPGACPRAYWIAIQYAANGDLRRGFPAGAGLAERLHRVAPAGRPEAGRLRTQAAPLFSPDSVTWFRRCGRCSPRRRRGR